MADEHINCIGTGCKAANLHARINEWAAHCEALEARLAEREETVRKFGTVQHKLLCRAEAAEARLTEAEAALKAVMSAADAAKEPCGMDPESPAAIRNGVFANIAQLAAQGLGLVRGPRLADSADAGLRQLQRESEDLGLYEPQSAHQHWPGQAQCEWCKGTGAIDAPTSADDPTCPNCDGEGRWAK